MIESIGIMLTDVCKDIIPFYLSEAETESYPYAVYEYSPQIFRTKEDIYKITADAYVRVYSEDAEEAESKADALKVALDSYEDSVENDGRYVVRHQATTETCIEGVWQVELLYFVKQIR